MKWIVIAVLVGVYGFETIVAALNQLHSQKPVPERLRDVYDEQDYQSWLAYFLEVRRFARFERGFSVVVLSLLLLGPLGALEGIIREWTASPLLQTLLFLGIFQTFIFLLGIPFSFYETFSIEERHGFNRTTKATFGRDLVVNYLVTLFIGGLLVAGVQLLYLRFLDNVWMFVLGAWAGVSLILLFFSAFLSKVFLRLFNKFTPLEQGPLRARLEDLASKVGFSVRSIVVMDASRRSTKLNAALSGIGRSKQVILFDTLLEQMSDDQIIAVLGHELGHAVHKDTWRISLIQMALLFLNAIGIGLILQQPGLFTAFGFSGVHFGFALIMFMVLVGGPLSVVTGIPTNLILRKAEYRADAFSAQHVGAGSLVSALKVLARENLANLNPHPFVVLLSYSHPPLNDRIAALE